MVAAEAGHRLTVKEEDDIFHGSARCMYIEPASCDDIVCAEDPASCPDVSAPMAAIHAAW